MIRHAKILGRALCVLVALAGSARADEPNNKARADELFREGERLFQAGEIAAACERFADSQRLDAGVGTLINLGLCHERQGRTATALTELREAHQLATSRNQSERAKLLGDEIAKLQGKVPRVRLQLGSAQAGLEITLDGRRLSAADTQRSLEIDPGSHTFVFAAPGRRTRTQTLEIGAEARETTVQAPVLDAEVVGGEPAATPMTTATGAHTGTGRRTAGIVLGAVGLAAIGVGTAFGLMAISGKEETDRICGGSRQCSQEGVDASDTAQRDAWISTVAVGAGIAAAGVGTYLFFSAPRPTAAASAWQTPTRSRTTLLPRVTRDGAGVALGGTF